MTNSYIRKDGDHLVITDEGYELLNTWVTDSHGDVYAFRGQADPVIVAAAMARLSRRAGGLREAILEEFIVEPAEADALIGRVVSAYGDDSVQQLISCQFVVEGASNLLTKQLEWGRVGVGYLEQSTRYIVFDRRDAAGQYNYFHPSDLPPTLLSHYVRDMDRIFDIYSEVLQRVAEVVRSQHPRPDRTTDPSGWQGWPAAVRGQACDAARPLLPVSTRSTIGLAMSTQAADNLIMRLLADELPEAQSIGQQILEQLRRVTPAFFERTDRVDRGQLTSNYQRETRSEVQLLATALTGGAAWDGNAVKLVEYWPQHELSLARHMLFDSCDLPEEDVRLQLLLKGPDFHREVISAYFGSRLNRRHRPGRALENAHFRWELVGDYGTFRDLQRHRMVDDFRWQKLHPRFGYELPQLVLDAGCEDLFREGFGVAEGLFYAMEGAGYSLEAQYATLLGHRMRYHFTANLRELFHILELRTSPQGHPGYRKLCNEMWEKLAKVYPLSAEAMRFVNREDNLSELTRMADERRAASRI